MLLEENIIATTLLLLWGEVFSVSEELAIECLAPDLPISYRQNHCCLSDYLLNKGFFVFVFWGSWGVDYTVDNFSD